MAQQTTITLVDDVNGGPADETVPFGLDGSRYEIDLMSSYDNLQMALNSYGNAKVSDYVPPIGNHLGSIKREAS